jgi:hypothetical protein
MTRDELLTLCDRYVQDGDESDANGRTPGLPNPTETIIHCFRDAEISAAEMQSLLAYVCQYDREGEWGDADGFCEGSDGVGRLENPGEGIVWECDDDDDAGSLRRPR